MLFPLKCAYTVSEKDINNTYIKEQCSKWGTYWNLLGEDTKNDSSLRAQRTLLESLFPTLTAEG